MRNLCNVKCKILDDIDLFGKEPELYFKGNSKRTSWVGKIFTIIYATIYLAFFLYKLIRMIKNVDVDFYQTTTFTGETPSIHLTNEIFYGGFALGNPSTLRTFIDESIYYVEAVFMMGHKEGNDWVFIPKSLEVEPCKLEKFGEKYREIFKNKNLENLYCLKEMDVTLEGHTTYDVYSYFQITFYPCVNTTENNNKCKPIEKIREALDTAMVTVKIQDIELTPENYNSPTQVRGKELSSPVYKNLYQNIAAYFHIVHIETDIDFIGFELFKNIQTQTYFKHDGTFILPSINEKDIYNNFHEPLCHISIQLTEQILTLKRTNTKLVEVLGDVGGVMEVIFSIFRIFTSFLTDSLYEQSLVNHLFSFDLNNKTVSIKKEKNKRRKISEDEDIKIYSPSIISAKLSQNSEDIFSQSGNKLSDEALNFSKSKPSNETLLVSRTLKVPIRKSKKKSKTKSSLSTKYENIEKIKNIKNQIIPSGKTNINDLNFNYCINPMKESDRKTKKNIINKVKIGKFCTWFCFLCARKTNNMQNVLLDEGMRIIAEKLDILFLFRKMYRIDKIQEQIEYKDEIINMSDKCKNKIQKFL